MAVQNGPYRALHLQVDIETLSFLALLPFRRQLAEMQRLVVGGPLKSLSSRAFHSLTEKQRERRPSVRANSVVHRPIYRRATRSLIVRPCSRVGTLMDRLILAQLVLLLLVFRSLRALARKQHGQ